MTPFWKLMFHLSVWTVTNSIAHSCSITSFKRFFSILLSIKLLFIFFHCEVNKKEGRAPFGMEIPQETEVHRGCKHRLLRGFSLEGAAVCEQNWAGISAGPHPPPQPLSSAEPPVCSLAHRNLGLVGIKEYWYVPMGPLSRVTATDPVPPRNSLPFVPFWHSPHLQAHVFVLMYQKFWLMYLVFSLHSLSLGNLLLFPHQSELCRLHSDS